jgi:hypothetical protein
LFDCSADEVAARFDRLAVPPTSAPDVRAAPESAADESEDGSSWQGVPLSQFGFDETTARFIQDEIRKELARQHEQENADQDEQYQDEQVQEDQVDEEDGDNAFEDFDDDDEDQFEDQFEDQDDGEEALDGSDDFGDDDVNGIEDPNAVAMLQPSDLSEQELDLFSHFGLHFYQGSWVYQRSDGAWAAVADPVALIRELMQHQELPADHAYHHHHDSYNQADLHDDGAFEDNVDLADQPSHPPSVSHGRWGEDGLSDHSMEP